jgi:hypothetical protein
MKYWRKSTKYETTDRGHMAGADTYAPNTLSSNGFHDCATRPRSKTDQEVHEEPQAILGIQATMFLIGDGYCQVGAPVAIHRDLYLWVARPHSAAM